MDIILVLLFKFLFTLWLFDWATATKSDFGRKGPVLVHAFELSRNGSFECESRTGLFALQTEFGKICFRKTMVLEVAADKTKPP